MKIYKQKLPLNSGVVHIELPYDTAEEARQAVRHVGLQFEEPCVWYEHQDNKDMKKFVLIAVGTGHEMGDLVRREEHIGTVLVADDFYVWHYFLVDEDELHARYEKMAEK